MEAIIDWPVGSRGGRLVELIGKGGLGSPEGSTVGMLEGIPVKLIVEGSGKPEGVYTLGIAAEKPAEIDAVTLTLKAIPVTEAPDADGKEIGIPLLFRLGNSGAVGTDAAILEKVGRPVAVGLIPVPVP